MSTFQWILLGLTVLLAGWMLLKRRGDISSDEAWRWVVEDEALLLDVRTPMEFSAGHLPNAKNVPLADLERKIGQIGEKERPIVVYCRSGARSAMAKSLLLRAGFRKIANLGAMSRWRDGAS